MAIYIGIFATLFGIYMIAYGIRERSLSGFRFYFAAGLMQGLPYLLVPVFLWFMPDISTWVMVGVFLLAPLISGTWRSWQEAKMRQRYPVRWNKWIGFARQTSVRERLLLFPGAKRIGSRS